MSLKSLVSPELSKIPWLSKATKKHGKLEKKAFSKVIEINYLGEIVPVKTKIADKEGNLT
jgi:hypothetical protein